MAPPIDPDVAPAEAAAPAQWPVLGAVAVGGAVGALARYAATRVWPTEPGDFPWTILAVNLLGCLLIGVLLVVLTERGPVHPLWRPLLGTGVLGGFTTFSAYSVDLQQQLADGRLVQAAGYGLATLMGAVLATAAAVAATRRLTR